MLKYPVMDASEREIYIYLKPWRHSFISGREISRRAGGKHRYREDEGWAKPVLDRMVERGILEIDHAGHFRIKPRPAPVETDKKKKWVSPQVAEILKASGKDFRNAVVFDDEADMDAYYENL